MTIKGSNRYNQQCANETLVCYYPNACPETWEKSRLLRSGRLLRAAPPCGSSGRLLRTAPPANSFTIITIILDCDYKPEEWKLPSLICPFAVLLQWSWDWEVLSVPYCTADKPTLLATNTLVSTHLTHSSAHTAHHILCDLFKEAYRFVGVLVSPALNCFTDSDSRIRYYACEALYNICKVCRGSVLQYFNDILDGLSKVSSLCEFR